MSNYRIVNGKGSQIDRSTGKLVELNISEGDSYTLPTASSLMKGGVKIGNNLTMVGDTLNASDPSYNDTELVSRVTGLASDVQDLTDELQGKQNILVSSATLKTVNGNSLLGAGDLVIQGGGGGDPQPAPSLTPYQGGALITTGDVPYMTIQDPVAGNATFTQGSTTHIGDYNGGRVIYNWTVTLKYPGFDGTDSHPLISVYSSPLDNGVLKMLTTNLIFNLGTSTSVHVLDTSLTTNKAQISSYNAESVNTPFTVTLFYHNTILNS